MAETIISPGVFARENDISFIQPAPVSVGAAIIGPTVKGPVEIPTVVTSYNDYSRKFGVTFESGSTKQEFLTSMAVKSYFDQGGESVLVSRVVSGSAGWTRAESTTITAVTSSIENPFIISTIGKGELYNNNSGSLFNSGGLEQNTDGSLKSGSVDNLRWEISNVDSNSGTFTLSVRAGNDSTKNKVILETFNNLSLDPNSPNYIASVIGDQRSELTSGQVITTGDYVNRSNYIYISAVNKPTLNYLGNDGVTIQSGSDAVGYDKYLPTVQSGSFYGAEGSIAVAGAKYFGDIDTNVQGLIGTDYDNVVTLLGNKDEFQFNIVSVPGLTKQHTGTQVDNIISLAETRGDCIAVVDLVDYDATLVSTVTGQAATLNSSYAASYWPYLQMQSATGKLVWVPASVVIPGIYAFTDGASAPWFAPAGLVRGGLTGVIQAKNKLSRTDRDSLYTGKVNPIATFPGTGIAVFGQKTLQTKASALDRVNVRRLLIELKKFLGDQARNLVFEQNTIATRNRFLAAVNPYLESVVQRQGLFAYRVVMDDTNNTADVVDRNQLVGQIFIQPAKTAEFIILDFVVEPTGATFDA
jgi:phage tail sheath protein FI